MHKLYRKFVYCVGMTCSLMFFVMFGVSLLQVFFRYVLNDSLIWSEELARYLFVWISFLGGTLVMDRGTHIKIDILENLLRGGARKAVVRAAKALVLVFLVLLTVSGVMIVGLTMDQPSAVMQIPMGLVYLAIPVGSIAMIVSLVMNFANDGVVGEAR